MARRYKAYLAGPDVFLPNAIEVGHRKKKLCALYGFEGLYPFDNEVFPETTDTRIDLLIYRANVAMIREADFGIFNLTSFRGPSADVGTVFELGMMAGFAKPVFGYTGDAEDLLSRVRQSEQITVDSGGQWRDGAGMTIENFGNADNLMVEAVFVEQGHPIVRYTGDADLGGFEECLRRAADVLDVGYPAKGQRTKKASAIYR